MDAPGPVLPADFESVEELLVTWDAAQDLAPTLLALIAEASHATNVTVLLRPDQDVAEAGARLADAGARVSHVKLLPLDVDSLWVRDYGPMIVRDASGARVVDFDYAGEAGDDNAPAQLALMMGFAHQRVRLRLEGGNLLSNGAGRCVTSTALIAANAQQHSEQEIRALLRLHVGCRDLIVLPRLDREPTGHVDMYVALVGPTQALVGSYRADQDPANAKVLDRAAAQLAEAGFVVRRIPMPDNNGERFRSFVNIVVVNGVVLFPTYSDIDVSADRNHAERVLAKAFPRHDLIAIDSTALIESEGALHCVTSRLR